MSEDVVGKNLGRLRREKKMTQAELAKASGITRVGYSKIERGETNPRAETLRKLARSLGVNISQLVTSVVPMENVRFRAEKKLAIRESVLVEVGRRLRDFSELEALLDAKSKYKLERVSKNLRNKGRARAIEASKKVRMALNLGPKESIHDICGLLEERAGIKVLSLTRASDSFFGLSVASKEHGRAIVINTWERISVERWIFTAAHELGHLVLHGGDYDADLAFVPEEPRVEKEANVFASFFLMPEEMFDREWAHTHGMGLVDRVLHLKRIFKVSYKTVLYRLSEILPIGNGIWPLFSEMYRRQYKRILGKKDEPDPLEKESFSEDMRAQEPEYLSPVDFRHDRLYRLVRHSVEEERISVSRGAEILGMSIQEMRDLMSGWVKEKRLEKR